MADRKKVTRFKCVVCGKLTAGRISRGRYDEGIGDGSARFPRRHKGKDGKPCVGNIQSQIGQWLGFMQAERTIVNGVLIVGSRFLFGARTQNLQICLVAGQMLL